MSIGNNIKKLRITHGLSQSELGEIAGVTDKAVSTWENGDKIPRMGAIERMSAYFRVKKSELIDDDLSSDIPGLMPPPKTYKVPRLGTIACGEPILAEENISDYDDVPENIHCNFTLKCKGDSMTGARINDGDIVYIRLQPDVENGEIAAVLIDEASEISDATLKKVYKSPGKIRLQPANPDYEPYIYTGDEMNRVRIIGKAVGFTSVIK